MKWSSVVTNWNVALNSAGIVQSTQTAVRTGEQMAVSAGAGTQNGLRERKVKKKNPKKNNKKRH